MLKYFFGFLFAIIVLVFSYCYYYDKMTVYKRYKSEILFYGIINTQFPIEKYETPRDVYYLCVTVLQDIGNKNKTIIPLNYKFSLYRSALSKLIEIDTTGQFLSTLYYNEDVDLEPQSMIVFYETLYDKGEKLLPYVHLMFKDTTLSKNIYDNILRTKYIKQYRPLLEKKALDIYNSSYKEFCCNQYIKVLISLEKTNYDEYMNFPYKKSQKASELYETIKIASFYQKTTKSQTSRIFANYVLANSLKKIMTYNNKNMFIDSLMTDTVFTNKANIIKVLDSLSN